MTFNSKEISGKAYSHTANDDSKDLSIVLAGALAGAAAGSVISGFFTQKGIKVRKNISKRGKNISNNLKDKVAGIADGIADKYEAVKENASDIIEKGKQKVGIADAAASYKKTTDFNVKKTGSKVLFGAFAVSVAGAIIWSFASEKGVKTRKRLGKGSKNMAANLKEKFVDITDGISHMYNTAKEGAADLLEKGKQQADVSSGGAAYKRSGGADVWQG